MEKGKRLLDIIFLEYGTLFEFVLRNRYIGRLVHWMMWHWLPILEKRVLLKDRSLNIACNLKAIAEYVSLEHSESNYQFWFVTETGNDTKNLPKGMHAVKYKSISYYYICHTSHFLFHNDAFAAQEPKRHGQIRIETLHGPFGVKKVGLDEMQDEGTKSWFLNATADTDYALSNSEIFTRVILRGAFGYQGRVLEFGFPRNDIFFASKQLLREKKEELYNQIGISRDAKVLFYAPTFRKNLVKAEEDRCYEFDALRVLSALHSRFGGEWILAIHVHPLLRPYYKDLYKFGEKAEYYDLSYIDIQDILPYADALITDYSSAEMDFMFSGKPIFQYCKDVKSYERGFYISPQNLAFPFAENEEQLINNILKFDSDHYRIRYANLLQEIGMKEFGNASELLYQWMCEH